MVRKLLVSLAAGGALALLGGVVAGIIIRTAPHPPRRKPHKRPVSYRLYTVHRADLPRRVSGYGTVRAMRRVPLIAQVAGEVTWVEPKLRVGAVVRAGQVLVRIDPRPYQHAVRRLQALIEADEATLAELHIRQASLKRYVELDRQQLKLALRDLERLQQLAAHGNASTEELDRATEKVNTSRKVLQTDEEALSAAPEQIRRAEGSKAAHLAQLETAKLQLEHTEMKASFDAAVSKKNVEVGQVLNVGAVVAELVDTSVMEVAIEIPASKRDIVRLGAAVELTQDTRPQARWHGKLTRLGPVVDAKDRTIRAFIVVDNRNQRFPLLVNDFVRAVIEAEPLRNVIAIPREAVFNGSVFVANGGRAFRRRPKLGQYVGEMVLIEGGLNDGEQIVLTNLALLNTDTLTDSPDGAPITTEPTGVRAVPFDAHVRKTATAQEDGKP